MNRNGNGGDGSDSRCCKEVDVELREARVVFVTGAVGNLAEHVQLRVRD
ncbi:MAG: hypothetical protein O7H40_06310 [Gammaproteobacteria bacterium]|nr:hypothetical protein [Gammaproteobacteria bacterium]